VPIHRKGLTAVDAWQSNIKGLAAYELPRVEVQLSATVQSLPGERVSTLLDLRGTPGNLGRPITASAVRVELTEPGSVYRDRLNQVDFRVAKLFRFGGTRTMVNFDFFNVFNANPILNENSLNWRRPTIILQPRFFKISAQFDF
jgi:hypothetical protein